MDKYIKPPNYGKQFSVGIVGTINNDVVMGDESDYNDLGGIMYNILALHYLSGGKILIKPVTYYGYDIAERLNYYLQDKPNISTENLHRLNVNNPLVKLWDLGDFGKKEIKQFSLPAIPSKMLTSVMECDLVLINYISGQDIEVDTLLKFRESYSGLIYIDIHSLTLGIKENGERYYRQPQRWKEIITCGDMIQMNLMEARTLLGYNNIGADELGDDILNPILTEFTKYGAKAVLLTLGDNGAKISFGEGGKVSIYDSVPKITEPTKGEATGCGDIFAAAFILSILNGRGYPASLDYAVAAATEKYKAPGLAGTEKLKSFQFQLR